MNGAESLIRTAIAAGVEVCFANPGTAEMPLVGSGQTIATSYTYQPFGATTVDGSANGSSYDFTGRENDGTGFFNYRARYYSPTFQRFIAQDPIDFLGGDANLYGYVRNDPVNLIDPPGLVGVGVSLGGSAEGGSGGGSLGQGTAGTGGLSGGVFVDSSGNVSIGSTATAGGFSGPPGTQVSLAGGNDNSSAGGAAGGGLSFFFTNANCAKDLSGPFRTTTVDIGLGPLRVSGQLSTGYNSQGRPIFEVSIGLPGLGDVFGAGESQINTFTVVTGSWSLF